MQSLSTDIDPRQIISAVLWPPNPKKLGIEPTVVIEYADRSQEVLRGKQATDFWERSRPTS
ncbi:hypothetical protein ACQ4M4_18025 [Leptolyngbya sp. AN02str]|uniref:hypothetical protein n=1 Tax=Leptolyngbya sp. AN02str TaxID=3423363 RepID=UPI003D32364E